ncbi:hypothetical protein ACHAWF_017326 [Thalassiosira exigua]
MELPEVTIDDEGQLRILNPDVRKRSASLVEECQLLVSKVKEFQSVMASLQSGMDRLAKDTERQKLKAIGRRIKLDASSEAARREEEEAMLAKIQAKEREMEEFASYMASLKSAQREQLAEIEKLRGRGI